MLVAYVMKPKAGYDHLATAAQATGFAKSVDALVYYIGPENEVRKIIFMMVPWCGLPILKELIKQCSGPTVASLPHPE